jgi:hypothetical protein
MSDFKDWLDTYWVDLAMLIVQCGILATIVGFSRKLLRTLRASQEQMGALLRLSVSEGAHHDRSSSIAEPALAPPGFSEPVPAVHREERYETPAVPENGFGSEGPASVYLPPREQSLGGHISASSAVAEPEPEPIPSPSLTPWVAAPANGDTERAESLAEKMADSRRNLGRWLQEPPRRSGVNPFKKVVRWLQTPAGSRAH